MGNCAASVASAGVMALEPRPINVRLSIAMVASIPGPLVFVYTDGSHFEHDGRFADCRSGDGKEN